LNNEFFIVLYLSNIFFYPARSQLKAAPKRRVYFQVSVQANLHFSQKFITTFYHTNTNKSRKTVDFSQKLLTINNSHFCMYFTIIGYISTMKVTKGNMPIIRKIKPLKNVSVDIARLI